MRAVFCETLNGSWPDWTKLRKYGITRIYVDAREGTKALIDGILSQGFEPGMYRDPSWTGADADTFVKTAHADLLRVLAPTRPADPCSYMFDIELHSSQYLIDVLTAWRKVRPTRDTIWTMEPFQAGWFSDALVAKINADARLVVIPQAYYGDMYPVAHDALIDNVVAKGVGSDKVKVFYDGIRGAPAGFDGAVFTDLRLP